MEPSIYGMPLMRAALISLSDSSFGTKGSKSAGKVQPKDLVPVPISSSPPREISTRLLSLMKKSVGMKACSHGEVQVGGWICHRRRGANSRENCFWDLQTVESSDSRNSEVGRPQGLQMVS
jgi:hypothetical protein